MSIIRSEGHFIHMRIRCRANLLPLKYNDFISTHIRHWCQFASAVARIKPNLLERERERERPYLIGRKHSETKSSDAKMGNKCCSKRQDQDLALTYPAGYKKNDASFNSNMSGQKHNNGSLDSRYTPDPNRSQLKSKGGVDIIRPRTTPCKLSSWQWKFQNSNNL